MTNKAYLIISSLLILVILLAGRQLGYSFLERVIAAFIVGVLLFISLVHEERQRQQMNA